MNRKILLLNPPAASKYIHDFYCSFSSKANYYWMPQDLICLSGVLRDDFEVEVLDTIGANLGKEESFKRIVNGHWDAIIFTTGIASFKKDLEFMKEVKESINTKVIGVGGIFKDIALDCMNKNKFIDALLPDFISRGVIDYLKGYYEECTNVFYRYNGEIKVLFKDIDDNFCIGIPMHELFNLSFNRMPLFGDSDFAVTVGSFGCNFNCSFCAAGTVKLKKRSLPDFLNELIYLSKLGVKKVFFTDPNFAADNLRVLEFCRQIEANNLKIEWICNAHCANILDEGLLMRMKEAGCSAIMIGVESASDLILKKYNKRTDLKLIKHVFSLCRKLKIKTLAYFIFGLPGEDEKSLKQTIKLAKRLKCDYASFSYATADIGTVLRKESEVNGWLADSQEGNNDSSVATDIVAYGLTQDAIDRLVHRAYLEFYMRPSYMVKKLCEVRNLGDLKLLYKGATTLLRRNIL